MTKGEIIALAARKLGDTSASFIADTVEPFLELVLLELAGYEAIELARKSSDFEVVSGKRGYSVREITKQPGATPWKLEQILVYKWGLEIPELAWPRFQALRLDGGETQTGRWQGWRLFSNTDNLEVYPPAGDDDAIIDGVQVVAQATWVAPPRTYGDDTEIPDIHLEDVPCIVYGLVMHGAVFGDETLIDIPTAMQKFEIEKQRMWGRRFNSKPGRIIGQWY